MRNVIITIAACAVLYMVAQMVYKNRIPEPGKLFAMKYTEYTLIVDDTTKTPFAHFIEDKWPGRNYATTNFYFHIDKDATGIRVTPWSNGMFHVIKYDIRDEEKAPQTMFMEKLDLYNLLYKAAKIE